MLLSTPARCCTSFWLVTDPCCVCVCVCVAAGAAGGQTGQPNFDSMSVHELKQYLTSKGISLAGLNEKSELISKAKASG